MQSRLLGWLVLLTLLVSLFAAGTATPREVEPHYRVTDLGTLGGQITQATAINDRAQIAGEAQTATGEYHAFLWENGVLQDLGTLPGDVESAAFDLNNKGEIVGYSSTSARFNRAVLWRNGVLQNLGTLPGGRESIANSINNQGEVVGTGDTIITSWSRGFHVERGFLWKNGQIQMLQDARPGLRPGYSSAYAINDLGLVVGEAFSYDGGNPWPVLWRTSNRQQIRVLFRSWGRAVAINNRGDAVGSFGRRHERAFLWRNRRRRQLPEIRDAGFSRAEGINDLGQTVGFTAGTGAVLWENGRVRDLNQLIPQDAGWFLDTAVDINSSGEIVGWGEHQGTTRAFLLTPE